MLWKYIVLVATSMMIGHPISVAQDGYVLVGSARSGAATDCIQLTNSGNSQLGAVWFDKRLNLTRSFEIDFTVNLGNNPTGADGIVMVFQTLGNHIVGGESGGIGYTGLRPSLGIEFDTNQNLELGDPAEDHISLLRNGISDHRLITDFTAPVPISATQNTVKDGQDHYVTVRWDATRRTLRVDVDCVSRINQPVDLINTIFSGTSTIIWGFTSATGGHGNAHTVCLPKVASQPDTVQACRNAQIILTAPLSANGQYVWSPATNLDNSRTRTPRLRVTDNQLYTVQYTDRCGQPKLDSVFVKAKGVTLSLGDDRQVCENDSSALVPMLMPTTVPVTYRWSTGQTTSQLKPTTGGQYSLTVTAEGCSVSDSIELTINPLPKLGLSTDPVYDCTGEQPITLNPQATGSGLHYSWNPGDSKEPVLMATMPGSYVVKITTGAGCSVSQRFTVLDNCPSSQVFVPDAFTPNGDGMNDVFVWKSETDLDIKMKVFDRWGELIFMSTASSPYWDGTYHGIPCPNATYMWSLHSEPRRSQSQHGFTMQGRVLLLK